MLLHAFSTVVDVTTPPFDIVERQSLFTQLSQPDPAFQQRLESVEQELWLKANQQMTPELWSLLEHIRHTHHIYTFQAKAATALIEFWATQSNSIFVFPTGDFCDGDGHSVLPWTTDFVRGVQPMADAKDRAERIRAAITQEFRHQVAADLPPVRSEAETLLQDQTFVGYRCIALGLTALLAQTVCLGRQENTAQMQERYPRGLAVMSTRERDFFTAPTEAAAIGLGWRVEACRTLLWALGMIPALGYPVPSTNVDELYSQIFAFTEESFLQNIRLRSVRELLDAYESVHSLSYLIKKTPGAIVISPDVLAQRKTVLNWLTNRAHSDYETSTG